MGSSRTSSSTSNSSGNCAASKPKGSIHRAVAMENGQGLASSNDANTTARTACLLQELTGQSVNVSTLTHSTYPTVGVHPLDTTTTLPSNGIQPQSGLIPDTDASTDRSNRH